jgi:hypothetical protein
MASRWIVLKMGVLLDFAGGTVVHMKVRDSSWSHVFRKKNPKKGLILRESPMYWNSLLWFSWIWF